MTMESTNIRTEDLRKLMDDIAQIKEMLTTKEEMEETELTDWAKEELAKARRSQDKISHKKVKEMILSK